MLTRLFNKTNPSNYFLLIFLLTINLCISLTVKYLNPKTSLNLIVILTSYFCMIFSFLLINAIIRKLNLHKQHLFGGFIFVIFTFFVPQLFYNIQVGLTLFFLSFALYRLLALNKTKAAIFEFSLLTFLAAFFNYWALIFLLFLIIYIMFFNKFDYKNLIIPIVAFFTVFIIVTAIDILFKLDLKQTFLANNTINFNIEYFSSTNQRLVFSLLVSFIMFFTVLYFFQSSHISSKIKPYYQIFFIFFVISILFFLIDQNKTNESLMIMVIPITIFGGRYLENLTDKRLREIVVWTFVVTAFSLFAISL